jgi:hypothetical protein
MFRNVVASTMGFRLLSPNSETAVTTNPCSLTQVSRSVLPTTVYIGHPYHKLNGASAGYSLLNALSIFVILMMGLFPYIEVTAAFNFNKINCCLT